MRSFPVTPLCQGLSGKAWPVGSHTHSGVQGPCLKATFWHHAHLLNKLSVPRGKSSAVLCWEICQPQAAEAMSAKPEKVLRTSMACHASTDSQVLSPVTLLSAKGTSPVSQREPTPLINKTDQVQKDQRKTRGICSFLKTFPVTFTRLFHCPSLPLATGPSDALPAFMPQSHTAFSSS